MIIGDIFFSWFMSFGLHLHAGARCDCDFSFLGWWLMLLASRRC